MSFQRNVTLLCVFWQEDSTGECMGAGASAFVCEAQMLFLFPWLSTKDLLLVVKVVLQLPCFSSINVSLGVNFRLFPPYLT